MRKMKQSRVRIHKEIDHDPRHYERFTGAHWIVEIYVENPKSLIDDDWVWYPNYVETSPIRAKKECDKHAVKSHVIYCGKIIYQAK